MKITPKTDKEISEKGLVPEGFYNYEVVKEEFGHSQTGNARVNLTLRVVHDDKEKLIWDSLSDWRDKTTKEFCNTQGLSAQYEAGEIPDFGYKGKFGKLHVVAKSEYIDKNGKLWKARNEVTQYLPFDERSTQSSTIDDNLNF